MTDTNTDLPSRIRTANLLKGALLGVASTHDMNLLVQEVQECGKVTLTVTFDRYGIFVEVRK